MDVKGNIKGENNSMNTLKQWASQFKKAGCSSISWNTKDHLTLWGRNFDFHQWIPETKGLFIPKNNSFYTSGNIIENNIDSSTEVISKHAIVGVGTMVSKSTPVLYDGLNDSGLMGGMLYFVEEAQYAQKPAENTLPLQSAYVVTYLLSQCSTIDDIQKAINHDVTIIEKDIVGQRFQLHWMFTDKNNESAVLECTKNGVKLYRNTMGILTNSPNYDWQLKNLYQYKNINNQPNEPFQINGISIDPYCTGTSQFGIPGDSSSPSRFVRAAMLKEFAIEAENESQGILYLLKLFQNLQYIKGMVYPNPKETEYTLYTAIGCSQTLNYYVNTYDSNNIIHFSLSKLKNESKIQTFELNHPCEFINL